MVRRIICRSQLMLLIRYFLLAVGNYRRQMLGAMQPAEFFDPTNAAAEEARKDVARIALNEMMEQLKADTVDIAIFDATNTTRDRRRWLSDSIAAAEPVVGAKVQLMFVESICNDEAIIRANVQETKLKMPDYKDMPEEMAVTDFLKRIQLYASAYQTLDEKLEEGIRYIKLIDVGRQIVANRIQGFLNSRIMFFLSNLHIAPRPILLTRHGESEYNVQGKIGGDSLLSPRGEAYALKLGPFMESLFPHDQELLVWTSTLRRTQQTASTIGREIMAWKALDEIDAGVCDGMTYEGIAASMPEEYAARAKNKFSYRYPRGESYQDIVHRLEPVIIELMRQPCPVLIVSHQATLRVLYAYLTDKPPESCPDALVPLHTVIKLTPRAYGCKCTHVSCAGLVPH
jgi:broad specificity phosphatase PhoE